MALTAAHNLLYLNLSSSAEALSDLSGLAAVSRSCPKLKELNLSSIKRENVECVEKLWEIMATMAKLSVLSLPLNLASRKMSTKYPKYGT